MTWRKSSETKIGGNYTWFDKDKDSLELLPLLYCIGNTTHASSIDYYLKGIFTGVGPCGGDPGWQLFPDDDYIDKKMFYAWTNADISGLDPHEGTYDEATVKKHVRATLENFRKAHPERSIEVDEVILRFLL
jgi:hypothetical protein